MSKNTSGLWGRNCSPGPLRTGETGTTLDMEQERGLRSGLPPSTLWAPWSFSPQFLQKILDPKLRAWAGQLHQLWKKLGKKVSVPWTRQREMEVGIG